jgi:hypothetical protein
VLQLLPTHLTVAEIAERMYVSRNTVKSQTISIYRKLGATSRRDAVDVAAAAGLFDTPAPSGPSAVEVGGPFTQSGGCRRAPAHRTVRSTERRLRR